MLEIPLSTIDKVPIAMWVGEADELCIPEQAYDIRDTIGDGIQYFTTIPDARHEWFASANEPDFVADVIDQLKTILDVDDNNFAVNSNISEYVRKQT